LQRGVVEELFLQRMQGLAVGHALDGFNIRTFSLGAKHQASADQSAIDED
jgi:hypothetical protein